MNSERGPRETQEASTPSAILHRLLEEHGGIYAPDWDQPEFANALCEAIERALSSEDWPAEAREELTRELRVLLFKNNPTLERLSRLFARLAERP